MPDNSKEITALEAILNSGTTSVTVDGTTTSFDLDAVRLRLEELKRTDTSTTHATRKRVSSINVGGAW